MEILVNGRPRSWDSETISYEQVVALAAPHTNGIILFTVQFAHGPQENPRGTVVPRQSVKVKSGMIFDVTITGNA